MKKNIIILMILIVPFNLFGQVKLQWDANTERDLAGYKVHYGTASRNYNTHINVDKNTQCTIPIDYGIHYYFAVTAYDSAGNESGYSNEVDTLIEIPDTTPPVPPANVRFEEIIINQTVIIKKN